MVEEARIEEKTTLDIDGKVGRRRVKRPLLLGPVRRVVCVSSSFTTKKGRVNFKKDIIIETKFLNRKKVFFDIRNMKNLFRDKVF